MAFEIHLPQQRIETSRGLWLDRLPIDFLDKVRRAQPDRLAFVGWNGTQRRESASPTRSSASGSIISQPSFSSSGSAQVTSWPSSCRTGGSSPRCSSLATASAPSPIRSCRSSASASCASCWVSRAESCGGAGLLARRRPRGDAARNAPRSAATPARFRRRMAGRGLLREGLPRSSCCLPCRDRRRLADLRPAPTTSSS